LAFPQAQHKTEVIFSGIEEAVLNEEFDAGLVIHESRFTYADRGLTKLMDMGDWWEQETQSAIPLGGIAVKRDLDKKLCATIDSIIKESVLYSWKNYPELAPFITANAQEMEEDVMRKHIELYVNEYTTDLGTVGRKGIETLFDKAKKAGLLGSANLPENIFY
jgi:1,4-dihydroxy-6-naphthoate synthase